MIINFLLFILCVFSFIGLVITIVFGAWWLSLIFAIMFCFMYYSFRLDHTKSQRPKEIILTYRNGDLKEEKEEDDDLPYFDRNNFKFN